MKEHISRRNQNNPRKNSLQKERNNFNLLNLLDKVLVAGTALIFAMALARVPSYFFKPLDQSRIRVHGVDTLSRDQIIDYLAIPADNNWLSLDPYVFALRLKRQPWIEKVMVRRRFPLGLDVYIYEEKPAAYLKMGKQLYFITKDHLVLNILPSAKKLDLPVIVDDKTKKKAKPGDRMPSSKFRGVWELMKVLEETQVPPPRSVSEIIINDPLNIQVIAIPHGIKIKFGFKNFKQKSANLYYALPEINKYKKEIEYIDLRYQKSLAIKKFKK